MKRPQKEMVILFLAVIGVLGVVFFLGKETTPQMEDALDASPTELATTTVKTLRSEGENYSVNAIYPKFGITVADAKIEQVVNDEIAAFKEAAQENAPVEGGPRYELSMTFKTVSVSPQLLSVELFSSQYLGGAHGLTTIYTFNYDLQTGKMLTLKDVLEMIGLDLEEVALRALGQLKGEFGEDAIFEEGIAPESMNYSTFTISDTEVTFIFQQYQVAAYAAGLPEVAFKRVK